MTARGQPGRQGRALTGRSSRGRGRPSGGQLVVDRERLLDAAERVIERDGSGASLAAIAAEAGVTKPIVYARVGSRAVLSDALASRLAGRMVDRARTEIEGASLDLASLTRVFAAVLATIGSHRELFLFVTRGSADDTPQRTLYLAGRSAAPLADLLQAWGRQVGNDENAAIPWAYGIVGMLNLAAQWWLEEAHGDFDRLAGQLAALVWSGIRGDA
jgi:AcrR family transcriptional regulator